METVLIVDDIAENLYYLEVLLKGNGFAVCTATNGLEALNSARTDPPDLIVSDILMPVMDGYALCKEWRADESLRRIPFIFYTATFTDKKDEALALGLGADRFLIKPQEPEVLTGTIRELLVASRSGEQSPASDPPDYEGELLRDYNEALFRKLEKKMADLERINRELEKALLEEKRLEEQLRQAQKMEAIGRFSAGIAHDFNNILTVIFGFGEMIRNAMSDDDPQLKRINHILAAAEQASNLTTSLLTFSRKQEMKMRPIDLNNSIRNVEAFLRRIIGSDIKLRTFLRDGAMPVVVDGGHIEQVLMNLAANARDAMPDGGTLSIGSDIIDMDEEFIRLHGYGTPRSYALLSFADTGIGMDDTTRQHIFEPFFTSKEPGKGTGLGLAIIYGIIQQHNGYITVYSEPGEGTTFRIMLPLLSEEAPFSTTSVCPRPLQGGHETILVVDDDASVRQYLESFLVGLGYTVFSAQGGQEAVEIFREQRQKLDLVLMDIIMPSNYGTDVAKELRNINRDIKIVYTSGYTNDFIHERMHLGDDAPVLMKPLMPTCLAQKVRSVLDC